MQIPAMQSSEAGELPTAPPARTVRSRPVSKEAPAPKPSAPESVSSAQHTVAVRVDQMRRVYYEVIDDKTGEVLRQIPPEEMRRFSANMAELLQAVRKSLDLSS